MARTDVLIHTAGTILIHTEVSVRGQYQESFAALSSQATTNRSLLRLFLKENVP